MTKSPKRMNKAQRDRVDEFANKLYDAYNPDPDGKINVSKDACIKEAMVRLGFQTRTYSMRTK